MKDKKYKIESMLDSEETNSSESLLEMGNIQMSTLSREQSAVMKNDYYSQAEVLNEELMYVGNYLAVSAPVTIPSTSLPPSMLIQNSVQNPR